MFRLLGVGQTGLRQDPLSTPGPYGLPVRFAVRLAGTKGFKIYGANPKEPLHYIESHTQHLVLHDSGHKKDKSPPLVSIQSNWPSWSILPVDNDVPAFTITVHNNDSFNADPTPDDASGEATPDNMTINSVNASGEVDISSNGEAPVENNFTISLHHTRCRPVTFQFQVPIPDPNDGTTTTLETFEWRRAPHSCHETRSIRKKTLPFTEAGDERPPEEKFVYAPSGSILVRLDNNNNNNNNNSSNNTPTHPATSPDRNTNTQPVGFTAQGEGIVASLTNSRDYRAWYYFQFWGAGATGELGEVFTRVAVMSGLAVWQDEADEQARRRKAGPAGVWGNVAGREVHGLTPVKAFGVPRRGDSGVGGSTRFGIGGVHFVQHGDLKPGHLAVQCGRL
ncbi:hypothetical protein N658DRAFT_502206 [Parathielavia hyrcaniae]|uniref:Uncharacterized protein n=1 Tax=Parathielavia hyrcaniae TaxID=113614 RepID=A0AAN6PQ27_9PEZI|nr:hypothetical protein N658DRAFT_502206 [Parathielavia hyrcaniae]